ncbi:MAG: hypothetical protein ACFE8U_14525 [Candidatus Hermodarchaeota archaeon]
MEYFIKGTDIDGNTIQTEIAKYIVSDARVITEDLLGYDLRRSIPKHYYILLFLYIFSFAGMSALYGPIIYRKLRK